MARKSQSKEKEEIKETEETKSSRKIVKPVITFDSYFARLLKENTKIQPHHKAPMRSFAKKYGIEEGTLEDFQRIFRLY